MTRFGARFGPRIVSSFAWLGGFYVFLAVVGLAPTPWTQICVTKTMKDMPGIAGLDFSITMESCDFVFHEVWTSVLVSRVGTTKKTVLLQYEPYFGLEDSVLPTVLVSDGGEITVSARQVRGIIVQEAEWERMPVVYRIEYAGGEGPDG